MAGCTSNGNSATRESTSPRPETKTVIPGVGGMNTVIDGNGAHTEMRIGNMRQTLGKNGFDWML